MFRYKRKKLNNMINGKELMLGDYVDLCLLHGNNWELVHGVVEGIYNSGELLTISINNDKVFAVCADGEVFSIRLTKEFFLQNGFIELYADAHIVRLYNRDNCLRVNIYPPENYVRFRVGGIDINYVHEFQHFLRLVNLSDYANNLKL